MDIARRRRRRSRRHGAAGDDRISVLPDELLGCILQRVGSTRAAARTSVLSRRWRRVWTHLPGLQLGTCDDADVHPGATRLDTVDAALHAIDAAAPAAVRRRLDVAMHCHGLRVHPRRVAAWLRFASRRRVEEVSIEVPSQTRFVLAGSRVHTEEQEEDLELPVPVWGEATSIALTLDRRWRLRLPQAGLFVALTDLYICLATMEASELGHLVSSQCPRLRNLYLSVLLADVSDVSIRSDSLQSLELCFKHARRFEVMTPKLEVLSMTDAIEARIYAPKLEEVTWDGDIAYDPRRHCFVDAGRHLRLLDLGTNGAAVASLMQRFDKADVHKLNVNLNNTGSLGHTSFLNETVRLPKCETLRLRVSLGDYYHNLAPIILHLLRSCNSIRKISVNVDSGLPMRRYFCQSACHCRLPENRKADDISLDALQVVKITLIRSSCEEVEFVEQLAKCHAPNLKKLVINCEWWSDSPTKEIQEKVCRLFNPEVDVKFNVS